MGIKQGLGVVPFQLSSSLPRKWGKTLQQVMLSVSVCVTIYLSMIIIHHFSASLIS